MTCHKFFLGQEDLLMYLEAFSTISLKSHLTSFPKEILAFLQFVSCIKIFCIIISVENINYMKAKPHYDNRMGSKMQITYHVIIRECVFCVCEVWLMSKLRRPFFVRFSSQKAIFSLFLMKTYWKRIMGFYISNWFFFSMNSYTVQKWIDLI